MRTAGNLPAAGERRYLAAEQVADKGGVAFRRLGREIDSFDSEGAVLMPLKGRFPEMFLGPILADKECEAFIAPFDVRLAETGEADEAIVNVVQPDISVICDSSKIDDRGCRGAPDWIIEVLSPHTSSKDHIQKRNLYEKYGVREYWLVHPLDCLITVFVLGNDGKFNAPSFHEGKGTIQVSILPGLAIDLDEVFVK